MVPTPRRHMYNVMYNLCYHTQLPAWVLRNRGKRGIDEDEGLVKDGVLLLPTSIHASLGVACLRCCRV